jgi:hypothetical protein
MALREEFEFIAYRCCYCHYWNPARKQKPTAPRLEASALLRPQVVTESSSDEEGKGLVQYSCNKITTTQIQIFRQN